MSGSDGRWAELSSKNERVIQQHDPAAASAGGPSGTGLTRWAALASQRERLADISDPDFRPGRSSQATAPQATAAQATAPPATASPGTRLVVGAA
jgi:hypothetical protein